MNGSTEEVPIDTFFESVQPPPFSRSVFWEDFTRGHVHPTPTNDLLHRLRFFTDQRSGPMNDVFAPRILVLPRMQAQPSNTEPNFLNPLTETSEYEDEHADEWLQMLHSKDCSKAPREFFCPISLDIMQNPVCAQDGHTYERREIVQWLCRNHKSPKTLLDMGNHLVDNLALKSMIAEWLESAPQAQPTS